MTCKVKCHIDFNIQAISLSLEKADIILYMYSYEIIGEIILFSKKSDGKNIITPYSNKEKKIIKTFNFLITSEITYQILWDL